MLLFSKKKLCLRATHFAEHFEIDASQTWSLIQYRVKTVIFYFFRKKKNKLAGANWEKVYLLFHVWKSEMIQMR